MAKVRLNQEMIESLVADKYIGATDFSWDGNVVEFEFSDEMNTDMYDKKNMVEFINNQTMEIANLHGRLEQAEKDFNRVLRESFNG